MIVCQLGACFVYSENGISLMNGGSGMNQMTFGSHSPVIMTFFLNNFNIVSCEDCHAIIIMELQKLDQGASLRSSSTSAC